MNLNCLGVSALKVMLREMGHQMGKDSCLMEELDEQFYVHVGRTKDYQYLTINANSKTSSEVCLIFNLLSGWQTATVVP